MSDWEPLPGTDEQDYGAEAVGGTPGAAPAGPGLAELVATTRELHTENADLLARVDVLEDVAEKIVETLADTPAGGAWCWRYLDPYETQALFIELRDWVDWMVDRYNAGTFVLPCWFRHGVAIEELTALYVSWRATYQAKPRAYSDELTAFHDRWFWHALERMKVYRVFTQCTPIHHQPDQRSVTTRDEDFVPFARALTEHVTPGADADTVHAAIAAEKAEPLYPKDPMSPVRWQGTWWAVLANSPDGAWVPRPAHVCADFEDLFTRLHQDDTKKPTPRGGDCDE